MFFFLKNALLHHDVIKKHYEIDLAIGVTTKTIEAHMTSSPHELPSTKRRHVLRGGTLIKKPKGLSLYGESVWASYNLSFLYILSEFSRLQFSFQMSGDIRFAGICLSEDLQSFVSVEHGRAACFHLVGEYADWDKVGFAPIPYDLAVGKETLQSSTVRNGDSGNAVNGLSGSVSFTEVETDAWLLVLLGGEYSISTIVIHKNPDPGYNLMDDMSDAQVVVRDTNEKKVFHSPLMELTETATIIKLPENTIAASVLILLNGENRVLSLERVEVIERTYPSKKLQMDIPIGSFFAGLKANYLTFVQGGKEGKFAVSHVADMKLLYGSLSIPADK